MYETIQVTDEEQHMAKKIYKEVSEIMSDELDEDIDLIERLSHEETPKGTGITLDMSDMISDMIRNGNFPFTLEKHLDGHFGESTGSGNVTTLRLERDLNLSETIHKFAVTGQLDRALEIIREVKTPDDAEAEIILTYTLAQYAKGWLAEEFIEATFDSWTKGNVNHDTGGIDFWQNRDKIQVGSITRLNSKKTEMEASDHRHILYQWDDKGNIHVADMNEIMDVNKEIVQDTEVPHTLTSRAHDGLAICRKLGTEENPRYFRYLWW